MFKDKERSKAYLREYYRKNKARAKVNHRSSHLKNTFGLSLEEYNELLKSQDFRCALCSRHVSEFKNTLSVDHCHETGRIRGLLCMSCNTALGHLGDTSASIQRVLDYINASV